MTRNYQEITEFSKEFHDELRELCKKYGILQMSGNHDEIIVIKCADSDYFIDPYTIFREIPGSREYVWEQEHAKTHPYRCPVCNIQRQTEGVCVPCLSDDTTE